MDMKQEIGKRIRQERESQGLTREELASRVRGLSRSRLSNYELGTRLAPPDIILELGKALNVSPSYLSSFVDKDEDANGKFTMIPHYHMGLSTGYGSVQEKATEYGITIPKKDFLAFSRNWLEKHGLRPESVSVVFAYGDSMSPRIQNGDILMIDTSDTEVVDGKVYAVGYDHDVKAKRLVRSYDNNLIIRSDNPAYKDEIVPEEAVEDLDIIGRIVWVGGEL